MTSNRNEKNLLVMSGKIGVTAEGGDNYANSEHGTPRGKTDEIPQRYCSTYPQNKPKMGAQEAEGENRSSTWG